MCERTIAEYEEELCPTKEEKERQHEKHQVVLHTTDIHQLIGHQEECLPHLQGDSFTSEDPQPSHMKEEEEGECPVGQEEDDVSKFPLTVVSVKTEEHEDKAPESSQLHHSPNIHQLIGHQEECLPHLQGDSFTSEDPQPSHMKEEEEGECPVGQEEDDVSKFPLTVVSVKTEEHEDKAPESSQLHHSPNVQQPLHIKEEEDYPQPTYIKEEKDDLQPTHMKEEEEGECVVGQEEDDVSKFPLTVVSVKTEEHEDKAPESSQLHHSPNVQRVSAGSHEEEWHTSVGQKELQAPSHIKEEQLHDEDEAQSLQLHHSQSEENRGAELVSQHITEADGEHCEDIKSEPDSIFAPLSDMDHMMSDSSDHSDHIQKPLESKNDSKGDTRHHTNNKHFDCSECGKSFRWKSHFTVHMRIHTGEKPFTCSVCKKSFSTKRNMTRHIRTHIGEKPFTCSVCKKSFSKKCNMTTHMRTHTGEKPFACSACAKRFNTKNDMVLHMRTHTGEKPFTCSVCKKNFSIKQHMTTHMRTHTGEKPFACSACAKRFNTKKKMILHMRTHTGQHGARGVSASPSQNEGPE
nr:zinc finger protein 180-like isoform X7 [Nerophis lumbriciformis]